MQPEVSLKSQEEKDMDDLFEDPHKYGMPTFQEFVKNPERWRNNPEQLFESIQQGSILFKAGMRKLKFWINGYSCETLEQVQRIARDMGYRDDELESKTELRDVGNGKWDAHVHFHAKMDLIKRRLKVME